MEELNALLERFSVLFVINDYSPFCFEIEDLLKTYPKLDASKVKVVTCSATTGRDLEEAAARKTRQRLAPYFFVNGLFFGGIKEILSMHESGDLRELFIQSTALSPPNTSEIDGLIAKYPVVVVANSFSPFCLQACSIIETYRLPDERCKVVRVDQIKNGKNLEVAASYVANQRELPYIFMGGKPIRITGQLEEMHKTCELEKLLMESGALEPANLELFEKVAKSKPVVLIGQSFSPFWQGAVAVLEEYGVKASTAFIKVDVRKDGDEIYKAGRFITNSKKLPYVFLGGEYLGSFEDLDMLAKDDKLEEELVRVEALREPEVEPLLELVNQHNLLLLTSSFSPFCLETEHLLKMKYRLDRSRLKIVQVDSKDPLQRAARYVTRQKQPPYLFVNKKHVKGYRNSLKKLHESGELRTILSGAGEL